MLLSVECAGRVRRRPARAVPGGRAAGGASDSRESIVPAWDGQRQVQLPGASGRSPRAPCCTPSLSRARLSLYVPFHVLILNQPLARRLVPTAQCLDTPRCLCYAYELFINILLLAAVVFSAALRWVHLSTRMNSTTCVTADSRHVPTFYDVIKTWLSNSNQIFNGLL